MIQIIKKKQVNKGLWASRTKFFACVIRSFSERTMTHRFARQRTVVTHGGHTVKTLEKGPYHLSSPSSQPWIQQLRWDIVYDRRTSYETYVCPLNEFHCGGTSVDHIVSFWRSSWLLSACGCVIVENNKVSLVTSTCWWRSTGGGRLLVTSRPLISIVRARRQPVRTFGSGDVKKKKNGFA